MKRYLKQWTAALMCAILLLTGIASATAELINPGEAFIIECLKAVSDVDVTAAVTKNNDPNNRLNQPGGYTAAVFFSSKLVNADAASKTESQVLSDGTSGGGCVEVYRTKADAQARYDYLQSLKALAGDSAMVGTVVVRVSSKLDAATATKLMNAIVDELKKQDTASATEKDTPADAPAVEENVNTIGLVNDYIFDNYYWTYGLTAMQVNGNIAASYDTTMTPVSALTYPTQDGKGYYVYEYYVSENDNQVHIYRVTFVSELESLEKVGGTLVALATAYGVLPSTSANNFQSSMDRFLKIIDLGQSYTSGNVKVDATFSEVNGGYLLCAIFDGLNK